MRHGRSLLAGSRSQRLQGPRRLGGLFRRDVEIGQNLRTAEPRVGAVSRDQIAVGAHLDQASGIHHADEIGALHGGEPVGDDERGAVVS